ncbi:P-loop containing nucleoside triphosphate hydrolase protein [Phaeosphaeriaceae sp. PMI808]|nr:P-loop containing nucleoside triphosphate hydrolase protein [Phaeosphaeriaceae sp. PMI808]
MDNDTERKEAAPVAELVAEFVKACQTSVRSEGNTVAWNHLELEGAGRGHEIAPTIGSMFQHYTKTFSNFRRKKPTRKLLHDFCGQLEPGELLMVIGRPGSGCTSFLKALCHLHGEYIGVAGTILYSGKQADFKATDAPAETTFCAEDDIHFPSLAVDETLRFAIKSRFGNVMSEGEVARIVVILARLFGIDHILGTKVGDHKIQGVSGGERRRVSLAEAFITCPDLLCYDNPTAGLDSSTALEFVQMLHEYARQTNTGVAMSLYQGSDEMVPLFDKVSVINSGRCIYYGPMKSAKAYFEALGFFCPPMMSITDFLNSMSADPEARHLREGVEPWNVPQSPEEFVQSFRQSLAGKEMALELDTSTSDEDSNQTGTNRVSTRPRYPVPIWMQILLCAYRQYRIFITDYNSWIIEATCMIVQSIILGTVFRNLPHSTQSLYQVGSVVFYTIMIPGLQSMSEFGNTFAQRPLLLKHKRYRFYHPLSYGYGQIMTDIVWKIVAIAYNIPMYFLANLQRKADRFFIFFLVAYISHLTLSMFFRLIAVLSPSVEKAGLPVGFFLTTLVIYTGWYIPPPQMQVWLKWFRYINPMYYAFESLMINEVGSLQYSCSPNDLIPRGPNFTDLANQACAIQGSEPGNDFVQGSAYLKVLYDFDNSHLWRNIGINAGLFFLFAVLSTPWIISASSSGRDKDAEAQKSANGSPVRKSIGSKKEDRPFASPAEGRSLAWRDLHLAVTVAGEEKVLLNHLHGYIAPSSMTALMGVSGAGKTTLLNTLAGRLDFGELKGTLYLDGSPLPKSFRRRMGYVQQQDVHLPTQTVREALRLPAYLRQSTSVPIEEKNAYVEEVMELLEIEDIANALIGVPGAGLNLEQRKRVSMGIEMAAKPEILFLDEPTSGLDGQSAISIIQLLKKLSRSGHTILCTIHQPSATLMDGFDNLLLLAKGGKTVFEGPLGEHCSAALGYFAQHVEPCKPEENPAEYFLATVGAGSRSQVTADWTQIWLESKERRIQEAKLQAIQDSPPTKESRETLYATSLINQLHVILRRTWLWYWREPQYFSAKLWLNLSNGLLNGLTYMNIPSTQQGAYNRVFTVFMSFLMGPPLGLALEPRFAAFRDIFIYREKASRSYSWIVFVLSSIIVELPFTLITALVYWLLWYFPAGLQQDPAHAGYSLLCYWLLHVFVVSLSFLIVAWMPNLNASLMANGFFYMFVNTFAGTLTARDLTPAGWRWFFKVSPLYYLSEGLTTNSLYGTPVHCTSSEVTLFNAPANTTCIDFARSFLDSATGYLRNPDATGDCEYCRYSFGQDYYKPFGYNVENRYRNTGVFIGFIAFNFTAVIIGTYLTKVKKWKRKAQ